VKESSVAKSAMKGVAAESSVVGGIAKSARGEEQHESVVGRRFAKSAVGSSEDGVKIKKGNHSLHALGTWDQAGAENVEVWDHTDNNNPITLRDVVEETELKDAVENKPVTLQDVVKDSKLKDAVEKKPVESPAIRCVGIEYAAGEARTVGDQTLHTIRVGDKTDTLEIEEEHCLEAVLMNTASAHTFDEGYITAEKQGEVAEHINGSGGGHASIQVFIVGCLSLLRGGDQNRTKSVESFTTKAVENDYTAENIHPKKLKDAGKDGDDPVRLRDVLKENQMKDSANNEGGHALKSQPPGVQGGALHGATDAGGEASQEKLTSFEVLLDVGGGHALLGARPEDVGHQGVSLPHHTDGGHVPTDDERAEEQPARMYAYKNAAVELYYAESARVENKKTYRNTELPRHSALMPSRCPEDSMGGDIVEGPVVFPSQAFPRGTEAGARSRQASAQGFIWVRALMG